ncbi:Crp/Fnr family transcriptional regulator [Evansella sp. AB-P1]|uniref:Crp/Fnr family transcriptional regulator n=1 Tax=Evansella sp. AB-P1 TaxID=3037653 RepID=UPI00241F9B0F|nr:Crp/Fnr family transcriptional regulator [Evansella sp. AB-P1]MDG5788805.1 Crp/Fnr family transcriptional regulator [Evansella sp. AB-P1]
MGCSNNCDIKQSCLSRVPLFKGLDLKAIHTLQSATESHTFHKGNYIFQEGDISNGLFVVKKGLVKLFKLSADGKEQIIRLLFPGDFLGQFALLQNDVHYANAEVLEETVICIIAKDTFIEILEENPKMSLQLITTLNTLLMTADEWMTALSLMDVEKRLAKIILLFFHKIETEDDYFTLPISKRDLASMLGTTPETVSRKLFSFADRQLIQLKNRRDIRVVDSTKLTAIAEI